MEFWRQTQLCLNLNFATNILSRLDYLTHLKTTELTSVGAEIDFKFI